MRIKGMDGHEYNVTGSGQGNLNTVLGAIGTAGALGVGNGCNGGILGNLFGGNGWNNRCGGPVEVITSDDRAVSRYEAGMMDKLAAKDSEIALLKSNTYTDQKISDTYITLNGQINELAKEVRANKEAQCEINREQAVYNGVNTATLKSLQNQITQLAALSELVVPQRKVCDTCCNSCQ